jgi:hypothetical protein
VPGFIGNFAANQCVKCADQCAECAKTLTTCTKCKPASETTLSLFYKDTCVDSCEPEISVRVGDECVPCDPSCATCAVSPTQCMTCAQHMKYDPLAFVCTAEC